VKEKFILTIIETFSTSSIGELELNDGTFQLTLRKERMMSRAAEMVSPEETGVSSQVHLGISAATAPRPGPDRAGQEQGDKINSPIVATFYAAPKPDAPPFVKPGSRVKAGETLCILEAMKMMNHLEAEFDCEIIEVHATSGDLVEYGQPLFTVKRI